MNASRAATSSEVAITGLSPTASKGLREYSAPAVLALYLARWLSQTTGSAPVKQQKHVRQYFGIQLRHVIGVASYLPCNGGTVHQAVLLTRMLMPSQSQ